MLEEDNGWKKPEAKPAQDTIEQVTDELAKAILSGQVAKACRLQAILRIDICSRLANRLAGEGLANMAWLASIDPRSGAAKRSALCRVGQGGARRLAKVRA